MDYRDIRSTLVTKLSAFEDRARHHVFFYLAIDGHDFRAGKLSHSARGQAEEYVINDTAHRLKLTKKEFVSLVDCDIDKEEHEKIWKQRDP